MIGNQDGIENRTLTTGDLAACRCCSENMVQTPFVYLLPGRARGADL